MDFTFDGAAGAQPVGYSITVPISYQANDAKAPEPNSPIVSQDMTSTYYWMYHYRDVIDMFNAGLKNTWGIFWGITPLNSHVSNLLLSIYPSYFEFDLDTCKIALNVDKRFIPPLMQAVGDGRDLYTSTIARVHH